MKPSFPSLLVSLLLSLLVQVSGLELLLQPQTVAGGTSVVFYTRDPSDPPSFTFDLHFTAPDGTTVVDKGLAYPKISVSPGQTTGIVPIVLPSAGTYTIQAVIPQNGQNLVISSSNPVQVVAPSVPVTPVPIIPPVNGPQTPLVPPPTPSVAPSPVTVSTPQSTTSANVSPTPPTTTVSTTSPTPTTTPRPTSSSPTTTRSTSIRPATTSSSHSPTTKSSAPTSHPTAGTQQKPPTSQRKVNLPAVIGGVVGGLVFLGLLVALVIFLIRRKKAAAKRYTFHQDMMVQPRNNEDPSVPRVTVLRGPGESTSSFDRDLESGAPVEPVPMTAPVPAPVAEVIPDPAPATATLPKRVPSGPKKLILVSNIAPSPSVRVRQERERAQSPATPRTKRNFPGATSNPFNTEAENASSPGPAPPTPRTGIPAALTPAGFPTPSIPSSYRIEPFDPFQDYYKAEPEMTQVPPSPRIPSSAVVVPSPRGPRPSISGKRPVLAASSDASSASSHGAA